jgi:hypothetical protein
MKISEELMQSKRWWWVAPEKVLAGPMPMGEDHRILAKAGVAAVINLLEEEYSPPADYKASWTWRGHKAPKIHRLPIFDGQAPTREQAQAGVEIIDQHLLGGSGLLYIHCMAGRGRTGTLVGCWLVARRQVPLSDVEARLRGMRRREFEPCPETEEQIQLIAKFAVRP